MTQGYRTGSRDRVGGGVVALALTAAIGWALVAGLATGFRPAAGRAITVFTLEAPPPPPPTRVVPAPERNTRPEGRAAPPGLRARATEVVAPPPPPVPLPPPPVVVAPFAGQGSAPTAGAADRPGPGPGAGGIGDGTGAGGDGDGDGGGWSDEQPPELIRGRLSIRDLPPEIEDAGIEGTVSVRYAVRTDGRVGWCRIDRTSGSAALDALTCRLIQTRFRFRPARDGRGRPVPSTIVENHGWSVEIEPPPPPRRGRW